MPFFELPKRCAHCWGDMDIKNAWGVYNEDEMFALPNDCSHCFIINKVSQSHVLKRRAVAAFHAGLKFYFHQKMKSTSINPFLFSIRFAQSYC